VLHLCFFKILVVRSSFVVFVVTVHHVERKDNYQQTNNGANCAADYYAYRDLTAGCHCMKNTINKNIINNDITKI